jgi:hypothetical protein
LSKHKTPCGWATVENQTSARESFRAACWLNAAGMAKGSKNFLPKRTSQFAGQAKMRFFN